MHCFLNPVLFVHVWLPTQSGHSSWHLHKCPALNKCGSGWPTRTCITWCAVLVPLLDSSANSCVIILYEMQHHWVSVHSSESTKPHNDFSSHVASGTRAGLSQNSNIWSHQPLWFFVASEKGTYRSSKKGKWVHVISLSNPCMHLCLLYLSPTPSVHMQVHVSHVCTACGCQKTTSALILPFPLFCLKQGISLAWNFTKRARLGALQG